MFVPFETLPSDARLWIFQAERKFTPTDVTIIDEHLQLFTNRWAAHGLPLEASFKVLEDRFIVLAVNQGFHHASGCSIDDSTRTLKEIGNLIGQDLLKRDLVSFHLGDKIETVKLSALKDLFKKGLWNENTLTFNTLVADKGALERDWLIPARNSWLKRYIVNEQIPH